MISGDWILLFFVGGKFLQNQPNSIFKNISAKMDYVSRACRTLLFDTYMEN